MFHALKLNITSEHVSSVNVHLMILLSTTAILTVLFWCQDDIKLKYLVNVLIRKFFYFSLALFVQK